MFTDSFRFSTITILRAVIYTLPPAKYIQRHTIILVDCMVAVCNTHAVMWTRLQCDTHTPPISQA